jgi:hypothetical protein
LSFFSKDWSDSLFKENEIIATIQLSKKYNRNIQMSQFLFSRIENREKKWREMVRRMQNKITLKCELRMLS